VLANLPNNAAQEHPFGQFETVRDHEQEQARSHGRSAETLKEEPCGECRKRQYHNNRNRESTSFFRGKQEIRVNRIKR